MCLLLSFTDEMRLRYWHDYLYRTMSYHVAHYFIAVEVFLAEFAEYPISSTFVEVVFSVVVVGHFHTEIITSILDLSYLLFSSESLNHF